VRRKPLLVAVVALLSLLACGVARAQSTGPIHVRVILDTSESMATNDRKRLALLATSLLYDLVRPSLGAEGSFEVIPFHPTARWLDQSAPPLAIGQRIVPGPMYRERDELLDRLFALPYNAAATYFYPGLRAALDDLDRARGGDSARRIVIIVTDGVPLKSTRGAEQAFIRDHLIVPRLDAAKPFPVQVYVLAFGPFAATSDARDFFEPIVTRPSGGSGAILADANGDQLLMHMITIFEQSLGYRHDKARPGETLDFVSTPVERVAIVGLWRSSWPTPSFTVAPLRAGGGSYNNPDGLQQATHKNVGYSYATRWLLAPHQAGEGRVGGGSPPDEIVVLRPLKLTLTLAPAAGGHGAMVAMSGQPVDWRLRVQEVDRDPCPPPRDCDLRISYELFVPKEGTAPESAFSQVSFDRLPAIPPRAGGGTPHQQHREYDLGQVVVRKALDQRIRVYLGTKVMRGDVVVATLPPENHPITVYPYMQFVPSPGMRELVKDGRRGAMPRSATGWCTDTFTFTIKGQSPREPLRVRAMLSAPPPKGVELYLDNIRLDGPGTSVARQSAWSVGQKLSASVLAGEHRVCAATSKTVAPGPATAAVVFSVADTPYDRLPVFETPLNLQFAVAAPTLLQRHSSWLVLVIGTAALALAIVLLRRVSLPGDLHVHGHTLDKIPLASRLGLRPVRQTLYSADGRVCLGHVEAHATDLFRVQPATGGVVRSAEHATAQAATAGRSDGGDPRPGRLEVQRTYVVTQDGRDHSIALEYD
jgi:hypothetical protein